MEIQKIRKYKPCKGIDLEKVCNEIAQVEQLTRGFSNPEAKAYHIHRVPVAGAIYIVGDAKILNRHTNQSGRGNLRYLLDKETMKYQGLACEQDSGNYRRVA
ncbi:MAG: hypothetical protein ACI83O_000520 [Patescibacteria group bacterium]|jgi:hypothetical protein